MKPTIAAATLTVLLLAGCSSSGSGHPSDSAPASAAAACVPAPAAIVREVSRGLKKPATALTGAMLIQTSSSEQNSSGWPADIVAAHIAGVAGSPTGTWAIGGTTVAAIGPIDALNGAALAHSDWGTAAKPGSPAAKNRAAILDNPSTVAAQSCG